MFFSEDRARSLAGVYRILDGNEVLYVGESHDLADRLTSHTRRFTGDKFVSYVEMQTALPHHLKEREVDLIGAFYREERRPPRFQCGSSPAGES